MTWLRSNIKHGARLALFAMVVQFALTFGHSHGFAQAAPLTRSALQQADNAKDVASAAGAAVRAQSPANPHRGHAADDNCAICAVIAMAGSVMFATPPLLALPHAVQLLHLATDAEFIDLKSAGRAFQPRAPPAS